MTNHERSMHAAHARRARSGRWQPPFGGEAPFGFPGPFGPGSGGVPFGWGGRRRGGGRARRGDVRAAILALLTERPMHGYEMIQEIGNRTGAVWRPSPGSVYPTLQLLEDEGLITSEQKDGKLLVTLTDAGRAEAEAAPSPWEQFTADVDPAMISLRDGFFQLAGAVRQLSHAGTEEQKTAGLEVLADARRRLYAILAEAE